ncbi:MAG: potassium channel family protein [Verrucomicrobiota bacterium]
MLVNLLIAFSLLALTVLIHATGLAFVLRQLRSSPSAEDPRFRVRTWLLIRIASWAVAIHCVEITVWALFYWWQECLPDLESSLYFSLVTYTTLGYGDLVLPKGWRLLSGVEALTGILMCGWTTGGFFAIVSRMYGQRSGDQD